MYSFGIYGAPLMLAAAIKYYRDDSKTALKDSQIEQLTNGLGAMLEYFSQQTFLSGLGSFVKLAQGDIDYSLGSNIGFAASQAIPLSSLLRWVATIVDPVYRKGRGATEVIKKGIPGLSQELPPYMSVGGKISKREPFNFIFPWDVGISQPQYEELYQGQKIKGQTSILRGYQQQVTQIARDPYLSPKEKEEKIKELYEKRKRVIFRLRR